MTPEARPGVRYFVVYHEGGHSLPFRSRSEAYRLVDLLNHWPDLAPHPMAVMRAWAKRPLDQACH